MNDRKVHFSVPIHKIEYLDKQWETASRLARDGSNWLLMGLDRERFRIRIERTSEILSKIFDLDFRQQVYQERFENFVIPEPETKATTTTTTTTTDSTTLAKISTSEVPDTTASTPLKHQSTSQTRPNQTKHNNKRRHKKRRGKKYHSKHRG